MKRALYKFGIIKIIIIIINNVGVFSRHSICSNDRNTSGDSLRKFIPDWWMTATPPPLPVGRGVCLIEYPFGTMSLSKLAELEGFSHVSHIAITSRWFSSV